MIKSCILNFFISLRYSKKTIKILNNMPIRIINDDDDNEMGHGMEEMIYEVQKGDTLGKIAAYFYGDAKLYTLIFEANKNLIKDPNIIQIGWKLKIPAQK